MKSLSKPDLKTVAFLFVALFTSLATLGSTHFFDRSVTASANGVGIKEFTSPVAMTVPDKAIQPHFIEAYGNLPITFEANHGQTDARVRFLSRGSGYSLFLTPSEVVLSLNNHSAHVRGTEYSTGFEAMHRGHKTERGKQARTKRDVLRMALLGANLSPKVAGLEELPGKSNYFIGNDPKQWRTNVAHYSGVKYESVYRGVDLVYYGNQRQLEYDFIVAPGTNPAVIRLAFKGSRTVKINAGGELVLRTRGGEVRQRKPIVYQEIDGERREVVGRYVKKGKHLPRSRFQWATHLHAQSQISGCQGPDNSKQVSMGYSRPRPITPIGTGAEKVCRHAAIEDL
jgi:hypothetical protein